MKGALIFRINLENKADSFAKVSNFISKLNAKEIMSSSDVRGRIVIIKVILLQWQGMLFVSKILLRKLISRSG